MSAWLSAFGAKQTSDEAAAWFDPTLLSLSRHGSDRNSALQRSRSSTVVCRSDSGRYSAVKRRTFITLVDRLFSRKTTGGAPNQQRRSFVEWFPASALVQIPG